MAYMQVEMFSQALHMAVGVDVILPQPVKNEIGLESGEKTDQKYPTLWLLHGATDDQTTWQRRTSIERYVAPLGLAVVMPSAHLSSYTDMAHGGAFYTYIVEELPVLMRQFFPTVRKERGQLYCRQFHGWIWCNEDRNQQSGSICCNRLLFSWSKWRKTYAE